MRWIRFSCSAKVTPEFVGSRFSQFGMVDILRMDDEKSGTIRFFDHYSAFAARELNGTKINDVVFSVSPILVEMAIQLLTVLFSMLGRCSPFPV